MSQDPHDELLRAGPARLWRLIEARAEPDADVEAIDRRIWHLFGETRAIVFTDLAGFSRHVERFGIVHFLQVIHQARLLLFPIVDEYGGALVKAEADSFMLLFSSAGEAIACARAMVRACAQVNQRRVPEDQLLLGVGVGFGEVLRVGDADVWGREVNAASKLGEDTARAGELLVTEAARGAAGPVPGVAFDPIEVEVAGSPNNFRVRELA